MSIRKKDERGIGMKNRHEGMQRILEANYGNKELADKFKQFDQEQIKQEEAAEAEIGTD